MKATNYISSEDKYSMIYSLHYQHLSNFVHVLCSLFNPFCQNLHVGAGLRLPHSVVILVNVVLQVTKGNLTSTNYCVIFLES